MSHSSQPHPPSLPASASTDAQASSSKLNPSSLGLHNKSSRRQNRQTLTTSWIAAQGEQSTSSSGLGLGSSVAEGQQETFTPTITLTQPVESSDEVSTVLVAGLGQGEGPSKRKHSPVAAASAMLDPPGLAQGSGKQGGWLGRQLRHSTIIVDKPILEEEEEDEDEDEEDVKKKPSKASLMTENSYLTDEPLLPVPMSSRPSGSSWARSRAKSFPCPSSTPTTTAAMMQLPRPQPVEEEGSDAGSDASVGGSGAAEGPDKLQHPTMLTFAQIAVKAKKWKMRSRNTQDDMIASQTSREILSTRQRRRALVEIPRTLQLEILEEAHHIVHKTLQMYRSELGLHHKLTQQAEQHCDSLAQQVAMGGTPAH